MATLNMLLGGHTQIDYISLNNIEIKSGRNETSLGLFLTTIQSLMFISNPYAERPLRS